MVQEDLDPEELARQVALSVAADSDEVGALVGRTLIGDGVWDYRFASAIKGYEGWQWSVTLYRDEDADTWTVDESSLVPTDAALQPPAWVPWKDRLLPSDLSVTDAMGTDPDDPRLTAGYRPAQAEPRNSEVQQTPEDNEEGRKASASVDADGTDGTDAETDGAIFRLVDRSGDEKDVHGQESNEQVSVGAQTSSDDLDEAVDRFALTRRHLMTAEARSATAKRWYEGQHGPKSLSTRTAKGKACETCGFMIPLAGDLGTMFGVCANRWSPDDGRVVSLDHGCGEHSEIEPQEESHLWVQSQPAYDDLHIDVVRQKPREERPEVELMEQMQSEDGSED
ncbi:DUF3027 domain-containing protein [Bifidobacterium sp. M0353]|uniref:DUF3027 domain-containing protein n=1 Tax=Bifidobacterium sp. M0353 TaxID=2751006 RepID=UPI0018DD9EE2|nr:DUF3027 domain-containing protein [Bifidobacterium sp. M0353]MBI0150406.1 DUF3027 domain-containing protein [Bifidobacterium sp. M0353]